MSIPRETTSAVEFFVETVDSLINKHSKRAEIYRAFIYAIKENKEGKASPADALGIDDEYDSALEFVNRDQANKEAERRFLSIYSGTVPDRLDRPLYVDNHLLVKFEIGKDIKTSPSPDSNTSLRLTGGGCAIDSGVATFFRIEDEDGDVRIQGTAGLAHERPDMVFDMKHVVAKLNVDVDFRFFGALPLY